MSIQVDHARAVARLFKNISEDASFQHICRVIEENSRLKDEVEKVRVANEVSDDKIIRLKADLDTALAGSMEKDKKMTALTKNNAAQEAEIKQAKQKIDQMRNQLSTLQSEVKRGEALAAELKTALHAEQQKTKDRDAIAQELECVTKELNAKDRHLAWLGNFSFNLVPLSNQDCSSQLSSIFSSAVSLAENYFYVDFPIDVLTDPTLWRELKAKIRTLVNPSPIPLPLKNSPAANKMRTAAFLAVLGFEVLEWIFQPIYLLNDAHELSNLLSRIASTDPEMESYLRSVALAAITSEMQAQMITNRVNVVVRNVTECVGQLLLPDKREGFRRELTKFCDQAAAQWQNIQQLREKVEPSSKLVWYEQAAWKPLTMSNTPSNAEDHPPLKPQTNGSNGNARSNKGSNKNNSSSKAVRAADEVADRNNTTISDITQIAAVVWPLFCVNDAEESDREIILTEGYVLCEAEAKVAREEENQLLISKSRRGSAKQSQRRSRTMSMFEKGDEVEARGR